MTYTVVTLPEAEADFQTLYEYIVVRSPKGAQVWANAFSEALERLARDPTIYTLAPESTDVDIDVRQIMFKTRQGNPYRIIFTIRGEKVFLMAIRGYHQGAAADLDEIELP